MREWPIGKPTSLFQVKESYILNFVKFILLVLMPSLKVRKNYFLIYIIPEKPDSTGIMTILMLRIKHMRPGFLCVRI